MNDHVKDMEQMERLRSQGLHRELLAFLEQRYAEVEASPAPSRTDYFPTMFQWKMLIEDYLPAAAALARVRDEQAGRLLAGELVTGTAEVPAGGQEPFQRVRRFGLIVEMNDTLADPHATHALFLQLERQSPDLARRYAWHALPDIVAVGDFALAERYRGDPLALLADVNASATRMPLFPPRGEAPRLVGDLMSLTRDVWIGITVLRGLGRHAEADALRHSLLDGLANEELQALARRELDEPGTIMRTVVAHQMAQESAG